MPGRWFKSRVIGHAFWYSPPLEVTFLNQKPLSFQGLRKFPGWWFGRFFLMFIPNYLGKWSNLTCHDIFQRGWFLQPPTSRKFSPYSKGSLKITKNCQGGCFLNKKRRLFLYYTHIKIPDRIPWNFFFRMGKSNFVTIGRGVNCGF